MRFSYISFVIFAASVASQQQQQRYDAAVKNGTADAQLLTGFPPYGMPGAALPAMGPYPFPGMFGPIPLSPPPSPPPQILPLPSPLLPPMFPALPLMHPLPPLEDNNVCTMDTTVLVVLKKPQQVPITIQPPPITPIGASRDKRDINSQTENEDPNVGAGITLCQPNVPGSCGNAVRIRCAETAVADESTCTTCCQLAAKIGNSPTVSIRGMLVDSLQLSKAPLDSIRKKRLAPLPSPIEMPPLPPSCASKGAPCPTVKCMCCGPRLPFPQLTPLLPALPLQLSMQVAPLPAPLPQPLPFPLMQPPLPFGPMPIPNVAPYPLFPYTGQANPSANGQKQP